jgi:ankyrin repeat protein
MEIITALLAADVDVNPQLNFHRPSRGGNSGRFIDPLLNTGCSPLLRATMGGDVDVVKALLARGADPNINAMGLTSFLVAAGVGAGHVGGTGLAAERSAGGPVNMQLMEMLLQSGADVNAQVTGTLSYNMRVSRAPSANEGRTALHIAAQSGRADVVRYLLSKGANIDITDVGGKKAIDLVPAAQTEGKPATPPANPAEVRSLLERR